MATEDSLIRKAKWLSLKEEFIDCIVNNRPVTWGLLAQKYGFLEQTVRNKASTEGWPKQAGERKADNERILQEQLTARTNGALEKLNQDFMTNEATIRTRHATMARGLQARAIRRLQEIDLKDFKPRDALAMLELGLREERFAMGMKEIAPAAADASSVNNPEYKPVAEQLGGHKKVQEIGLALLKMVRALPEGEIPTSDVSDAEVKTVPDYQPVPEAVIPPKPTITIKKAAPK